MVTQVSLLDCELCHGPDNLGNKDGDTNVPSSSQENAATQMPVKKQTRQWAAWTRQEEESFFAALRQVGKNFEKITCRVQSKNKDQVRHYYYRLVRRMNKLLGPELSLDAKNSKDTNAAMLRWWSLLEKYSCKPSKLHLKPRRYKIFVETLENQLLKDRKKNIKKRVSSGENNSPIPSIPASNQVRPPGHDNRAVKMVLVDSQNIPKVGTGKGALFKRHVNMETGRNNCKVDPASVKTAKHRRKTGLATAAAYKRWEKAAIAGVSLVADAAEHLEKVDTDKEIENLQETPFGEVAHSLQRPPQIKFNENSNNNSSHNSTKLKLQLFPIDECTRKALEKGHHNPHLELTLSTRKKISSILEHLNRKWGNSNSSLLNQELMLFPYWAQRENLVGYQKWTKETTLCAGDVHYLIGSPSVFRLRYGWFSKAEVECATAQVLSHTSVREQNLNINTATEKNAEKQISTKTPSSASTPIKAVECGGISVSNISASEYHDSTSAVVSSLRKVSGDLSVTRQDMPLSAGEWADSLTNISVGDLLSVSAQHNLNTNCTEFQMPIGSNSFQLAPFSCDSFDAAIAAHIYKHQNKVDSQQGHNTSHAPPSIWDAEETCDAFSFQKMSAFCDKGPNTYMNSLVEVCEQANIITSPSPSLEKLTNSGDLVDDCRADDDHPLENSTKDFGGLTDIYWPDSLGPLDLDIPSSCRYHSNDLIFSDSLGGLNRLIANSVDAFQSCSFFGGADKKEPSSGSEARQNAPFSDFKVGDGL
ncbi:tsl-kinase interacting protein 1 [Phtheirospermum japonicum]|uniref:Tsl-kinase interacting protein 1 n=1 Tax=Phtheirospermum japonicum TaxID=374723 RepID=A0A830BXW0_9LAMI|nr:tsl-kinase interacting protein 1 [Phtheirospermum japonicum]